MHQDTESDRKNNMEAQNDNYIMTLIKGTENINRRLKKVRDELLREKGIDYNIYKLYQSWLRIHPKICKFKDYLLTSRTVLEAQSRFLGIKDRL